MEHWTVYYYNELDAELGHDCRTQVYKCGFNEAEAKSIARALNKRTPYFIWYWAEEDTRKRW